MIRKISDLQRAANLAGRPAVSVEFFPPKTDEGERNLFAKTLPALLDVQPDYCSVTYGAGGSTRDKTLGIVERIQREHGLTTMMHLTCVNATRQQLDGVIQEAQARGIRNILALRGDPPSGTTDFVKTEGGFEYSKELVQLLKSKNHFDIGTAGFPEGHIACHAGKHVDWGFLAEKVRAGADFVVTQLFFNNDDYYQFRDYLSQRLKVNVPIIAGILPVVSAGQTKKFTALCGAKLPRKFLDQLEPLGDDDEAVTRFGIDYATEQCADLFRQGAPGVHFYTLNKPRSTLEVVRRLKWDKKSA